MAKKYSAYFGYDSFLCKMLKSAVCGGFRKSKPFFSQIYPQATVDL